MSWRTSAMAVENALAFQQTDDPKEKLDTERLYLEDEIRTEHTWDEIVGQSSTLMRRQASSHGLSDRVCVEVVMKSIASALCLIVVIASSAAAQENPPSTLEVDGAAPLPLAGYAQRADGLGAVSLYSVGVYVSGSIRDRSRLASEDVTKAVRIDITYKDDLRRWVTLDWRPELLPQVEPGVSARLQGAFAPLRNGDVVVIDYTPTRGTSVRINRGVAVSGANHELMLSFLDHWIGQRPISEELKRALLGSV